jgi:hypothetical protein
MARNKFLFAEIIFAIGFNINLVVEDSTVWRNEKCLPLKFLHQTYKARNLGKYVRWNHFHQEYFFQWNSFTLFGGHILALQVSSSLIKVSQVAKFPSTFAKTLGC